MDVYIVKGENNCRKSSIVRALTGVGPRRRVLHVATNDGGRVVEMFIQDSSPQDLKVPMSPSMLMNGIESKDVDAALVVLRDKSCNHMPEGDHYISAMNSRGWNVLKVVDLEVVDKDNEFSEIIEGDRLSIRFSKDVANNFLAHSVRRFFGWL